MQPMPSRRTSTRLSPSFEGQARARQGNKAKKPKLV